MSDTSKPLAGGRRWAILATLFFAQMVAMGMTSYGYGLFVKPLAAEFGLSRADAGSGIMLILVGMAIWSPIVGRALDSRPARHVLIFGAFLFALGTQIAAWSHTLWLSAASTLLLIGGGVSILGPVSGSTLVTRWFADCPGRALGIITVSASAGGLLVTPSLAWIVEEVGWRLALSICGAALGGVMWLLSVLVVRDSPIRAIDPDRKQKATNGEMALGWRAALLRLDLWLLVFIVGSMMGIAQALLSSLVAYASDRGLRPPEAALLISVVSSASLICKLITGWLADRVDLRLLQIASVAMMAAFMAIMLTEPPLPVLMGACILAGGAIGSSTLLWAAFVHLRFGPASFGLVYGLTVPMQVPLVFASLRFMGAMFDRWQSYEPAFRSYLFFLPLVALAVLPLRKSKPAAKVETGIRRQGAVQ